MGGDGGVIASNRRYMRGAGTADHTGDVSRSNSGADADVVRQEAARAMRFCALSQKPLEDGAAIVACPYGRLYLKEAALEALPEMQEYAAALQEFENRGFILPPVVASDSLDLASSPATSPPPSPLIFQLLFSGRKYAKLVFPLPL